MARVVKIDNSRKKRFNRVDQKRATDTRPERQYFLIVCEGSKTEPNYFKALSKELPPGGIELMIEGTGLNTSGLVDYAIEQKNRAYRKYDYVWAVFDKDDFSEENFNKAIAVASANNIQCAWTNEAFELWFLLHFQYLDTGISRDHYKEYLEREIRAASKNDAYIYKKNDPTTYSILKKYGNQAKAIERAKRLKSLFSDHRYAAHNPCTWVYELIEMLIGDRII